MSRRSLRRQRRALGAKMERIDRALRHRGEGKLAARLHRAKLAARRMHAALLRHKQRARRMQAERDAFKAALAQAVHHGGLLVRAWHGTEDQQLWESFAAWARAPGAVVTCEGKWRPIPEAPPVVEHMEVSGPVDQPAKLRLRVDEVRWEHAEGMQSAVLRLPHGVDLEEGDRFELVWDASNLKSEASAALCTVLACNPAPPGCELAVRRDDLLVPKRVLPTRLVLASPRTLLSSQATLRVVVDHVTWRGGPGGYVAEVPMVDWPAGVNLPRVDQKVELAWSTSSPVVAARAAACRVLRFQRDPVAARSADARGFVVDVWRWLP